MSTRGYYVFVWNGWYYIFYNHFDSYPGFLGDILVDVIRGTDSNGWNELKVKLSGIKDCSPNSKKRKYSQACEVCSFGENLGKSGVMMEDESCIVTQKRPDLDLFIEWIYFIDLDDNKFEVKGRSCSDQVVELRYDLEKIPKRWYSAGM